MNEFKELYEREYAAEARVKELEAEPVAALRRLLNDALAAHGEALTELTRLKRQIEVKDGALRAALPALHDASAALDEGDVVTRYAKLYDQVRAALRGEEA